jgi:hypothetical protein
MAVGQPRRNRWAGIDARLRSECHRGVFDQRAVGGRTGLAELDDPGRAVDGQQGLGPRSAERGTRCDPAPQGFFDRLAGFHAAHPIVVRLKGCWWRLVLVSR